MSNQLAALPWTLDTVGTIWSGYLKVGSIAFVDYTADTDEAELQDINGNVVWKGNGHDDLSPVEAVHQVGTCQGLVLSRLDAGKLIVCVE